MEFNVLSGDPSLNAREFSKPGDAINFKIMLRRVGYRNAMVTDEDGNELDTIQLGKMIKK